jgi:hypothetical protein
MTCSQETNINIISHDRENCPTVGGCTDRYCKREVWTYIIVFVLLVAFVVLEVSLDLSMDLHTRLSMNFGKSFVPNTLELRKTKYENKRERPCSPDCYQHGTCNEELGRCDCPFGFVGEDCSEVLQQLNLRPEGVSPQVHPKRYDQHQGLVFV